jgi:hypothetical protein
LVSNCCNMTAFDNAFRREIVPIFKNHKLENINPDHPLYNSHFDLKNYKLNTSNPDHYAIPTLAGITIDGFTCVIYSPLCLGCAWEREEHPFVKSIDQEYAFRLGTNLIVYSMTH